MWVPTRLLPEAAIQPDKQLRRVEPRTVQHGKQSRTLSPGPTESTLETIDIEYTSTESDDNEKSVTIKKRKKSLQTHSPSRSTHKESESMFLCRRPAPFPMLTRTSTSSGHSLAGGDSLNRDGKPSKDMLGRRDMNLPYHAGGKGTL